MKHSCPNCGLVELSPAQQFGGKLACAAMAASFGTKVMKDPLAALLCGLAGLWIGNEIDQRCPKCGSVLGLVQMFQPWI